MTRRGSLGECEVSFHAVRRFCERQPEAAARGAGDELRRLASEAVFERKLPTGEEMYKLDGLRLIVHRIARRPPIVVTVLPRRGL